MAERKKRPTAFLTPEERAAVEDAIAAAEGTTSGEIRVVISRSAKGDPLEAARRAFARLGMQETRERNGVLIYLATADRKFAIYGDEGIHRIIGQEGWERIRDGMAERFARGAFGEGLVYAVREVGKVLARHFPWRPDDVNELPDEVVEED